jgi:hypothetical protein
VQLARVMRVIKHMPDVLRLSRTIAAHARSTEREEKTR